MLPVDNPPNPYLSEYREWLEPPPAARLEVYEETSGSVLSENDSPDVPFRWSCNPYRGCQHACAYCYARPSHEYLGLGAGTDFETKIVVKTNAPDRLAHALSAKSWRRELVAFSGVTDCYQPLEAVYGLTRRCLQVCLDFGNPASVITKSYLVMRDADLIRELQSRCGGWAHLSIPFADDDIARLIEPHAPPPSRRFEAMARLAKAGVRVGVMFAPIIPGLNDRDIPRVLARAAECGAKSAGCINLRLPGNVAPVFLARIRQAMPLRAARIEARIREARSGGLSDPRFGNRMRGEGKYWQSIRNLFETSRRRYGLDERSGPSEIPVRTGKEDGPIRRRRRPKTSGQTGQIQLPLFPA